MAPDAMEVWPTIKALSLDATIPGINRAARNRDGMAKNATRWRRSIFAIASDAVDQIECNRFRERDRVWLGEARQRAINFAGLGLSYPLIVEKREAGPKWEFDLAAIATLAGIYRLLARSDGELPVQCEHILQNFLNNFVIAYGPVCGLAALDAKLSPVILSPAKCRALVFSVGMLIQGAIRSSGNRALSQGVQVRLLNRNSFGSTLSLQLNGCLLAFFETEEYLLAASLAGILQGDLTCSAGEENKVLIQLSFLAHAAG